MRKPKTGAILLLFVAQVINLGGAILEEGSGGHENNAIIDGLKDISLETMEGIRGDGIQPEDYNFEGMDYIPTHNDFEDNIPYIFGDGPYDEPMCWTLCKDNHENEMICSNCPAKRPVKEEDIDLQVDCSPAGATVSFNLSEILNWEFEDMKVVLSYQLEGSLEALETYNLEDFSEMEHVWKSVCPGQHYQFCVEVGHNNMSKLDRPICQVSRDLARF